MSLHWILALTLTLTHCLTAMPTNFTEDAFRSISELQNLTCRENDSTFYSPSGNECIIQALNCSIKELNTVKAECFGNDSRSDSIKGFQYASRLSQLIEMILEKVSIQNSSPNCSCEGRSPTLPYHGFLNNIKTLIQNLNSIE